MTAHKIHFIKQILMSDLTEAFDLLEMKLAKQTDLNY